MYEQCMTKWDAPSLYGAFYTYWMCTYSMWWSTILTVRPVVCEMTDLRLYRDDDEYFLPFYTHSWQTGVHCTQCIIPVQILPVISSTTPVVVVDVVVVNQAATLCIAFCIATNILRLLLQPFQANGDDDDFYIFGVLSHELQPSSQSTLIQ